MLVKVSSVSVDRVLVETHSVFVDLALVQVSLGRGIW